VCSVLKSFNKEHPESLDEKGVTVLQLISAQISQLATNNGATGKAVVTARSRRDTTFRKLQRKIVECRNAIGMVAAREDKRVVLPRVGDGLWSRKGIVRLATEYCDALNAAGPDPMLDGVRGALNEALADFNKTWSDANNQVYTARNLRKENLAELVELGGKLEGLSTTAAFNVDPESRKELFALLRNTAARKSRRNGRGSAGQAAEGQGGNQQTVPVMPSAAPAAQQISATA
jgi:hypothetical protein